MHDTVTRNQHCYIPYAFCQDLKRIFEVIQPLPGVQHGVAKLGSAM